jgi:hypothetical protein
MATEPTMPASAQAAAVRDMLLADKSAASLSEKLAAITAVHPGLADGAKIVLEEGANPRRARSGSFPHASLRLADLM